MRRRELDALEARTWSAKGLSPEADRQSLPQISPSEWYPSAELL
jgi:hypothetical protein